MNDTNCFKKGEIGEGIIINMIKNSYPNYDILKHSIKDKAHWIDIIIMNKKNNDIRFVEVKTKARMNKFPMTGIDLKHYKEYLKLYLKTKIEILIYFIDDKIGNIYLLPISKAIELENQDKYKTFKNGEIICWFLDDMKYIKKISENKIKELTKYDERNYEFKPLISNNYLLE